MWPCEMYLHLGVALGLELHAGSRSVEVQGLGLSGLDL